MVTPITHTATTIARQERTAAFPAVSDVPAIAEPAGRESARGVGTGDRVAKPATLTDGGLGTSGRLRTKAVSSGAASIATSAVHAATYRACGDLLRRHHRTTTVAALMTVPSHRKCTSVQPATSIGVIGVLHDASRAGFESRRSPRARLFRPTAPA